MRDNGISASSETDQLASSPQPTYDPFDLWEADVSGHLDSTQTAEFAEWVALIGTEDSPDPDARRKNLADSTALVDLPVPCARDDEVGMTIFLPPTALNNLTGITPGALGNWSIPERHLLNHFLQSVSRTLVMVEDAENPFLRVIVPMALDNLTVKRSLVALSACHLSKVYPVFEKDSLTHRSLALRGLKQELENKTGIEYAIATTLMLCLAEVSFYTWFLSNPLTSKDMRRHFKKVAAAFEWR